MKRLVWMVPVVSMFASIDAWADDGLGECVLYRSVSNTQLLRRISLDLRRRLPSYDEYEALGESDVGDAHVDEMLNSEDFRLFVRRYHEDLLWPNIRNVETASSQAVMRRNRATGGGNDVLFVGGAVRQATYRGAPDRRCADYEQTEYCSQADVNAGLPGCDGVGLPRKNVDGLDGWVWKRPYWDPPTCTDGQECESEVCDAGSCSPMRVCAFDAQEREVWVPDGQTPPANPSPFQTCNWFGADQLIGCGCGPDLKYCFRDSAERVIADALREQVHALIDAATTGDLSYSDMLTWRRTYVNGPIRHFKRHWSWMTEIGDSFNMHFEGDEPLVDDFAFADLTMEAVDRPSEQHSGILTMPAFTLRFQTNRARANRLRNVFVGKFYEPPASSEQPGCEADTDDLTNRCYGMGCHQSLEPLAAHWGNFAEAGSALLTDREIFPLERPCGPGESVFCRFYAPVPDQPGIGRLAALQFAGDDTPAHRAIQANFDGGVPAIARQIIDDGTFARATVVNLWRMLMRRDMNLSPTDPDAEVGLLDELTAELREHDDFRAIVKRIVTLEQYRRAR